MVIDKNLKPIEDKQIQQKVSKSFNKVNEYLTKIAQDESKEILQDRFQRTCAVLLSNDDKMFPRIINDKVYEFKAPSNAWTTSGKVATNNLTTYIDNYIYIRQRVTLHQIEHEMVHALTSSIEAEKITEEIYLIKIGVERSSYKTTTGNLLEGKELNSDGNFLNEGLTDYMTYLLNKGDIKSSPYLENVLLALFLIGSDISSKNNLLKAFLSKSVKEIEVFEKEFDSYSNENIKYKDIANYKASSSTVKYIEMLLQAIRYRVLSAKSKQMVDNQLMFYQDVINEMQKNKKLKENMWYIFEDDTELIITKLKVELEKQKANFSENKLATNEFNVRISGRI